MCLKDASMSLTNSSASTTPETFTMAARNGGVGEVFAQLILGNPARVDGAHPALVDLEQGAELGGGLAEVDDDGALFLQSCRHVHGGDEGLVHDHDVVELIDVGVDGARSELMRLYAVMGAPMRSGPYSGKPWTHLRVLNATSASSREAVFAPAPAAVPTDLYDFFHALLVFPDFGFM